MAQTINTNIASLNAQRNLTTSQTALATSLQRLSSGLRINSAKDDAAGMAISERFSTQIRGLNQATRNANDGISLAQTGEGALAAVTDNLQRIRELAVQSANSTNSADDRVAINLEVQQRLAEIDRTASQTAFNGTKLLDGSFSSANFQIGANAGEVINIAVDGNTRLSATGAIASTTSAVLGASATGGSATTGAITPANFSVAAAAATSGRITFSPSTFNFGVAAAAQVDGKNILAGATGAAYDYSGATAVAGNNVQATNGDITYAGVGNLGQFNVDGIAITLNQDYANTAAVAADIQTQLLANTAGYSVTATGNSYKITGPGAAAVAITNADANALAAGFANTAGNVGAAAAAGSSAADFLVDGVAVKLNTAVTDQATLVSGLNTALTTAFGAGVYTAAVDGGGGVSITHAGSTNAVVITGADASAVNAGIVNSTGTAGTAAVSATSATFTADSKAVVLNTSYASFDALATSIATQMNTVPGTYTVTNNAGALTISKVATGVGSTAVDITAVGGFATNAGINIAAGTAGANAVATSNVALTVDGQAITLNGNHGTLANVVTELNTKLDAAFSAGAYVASVDGSGIKITNSTMGSAAVAVSVNTSSPTQEDTNATTAGFGNIASTAAGVAGGSITLANFGINGTSLAGTYASTTALATAINANVSNVYATVVSGALKLSSSADITMSGAEATGTLGFGSASVAANSGNLSTANVLTAEDANTTIQRIDAAMNSVSNLRSTFGAIQNRFESVISSLTATSENLSSARSRIQDADFAMETAALTRNQILQQAGIAMLAQANALPNQVLTLLRG